jgi:hypothetical protein
MGNEIDKIKIKTTPNVRVPKIPRKARPEDLVKITQSVSSMDEDRASLHEHVLTIEELRTLVRLCIFEADPDTPNLDEIGDDRMEDLTNTRRAGNPKWEVDLETYYGSYVKHIYYAFKKIPARKVTIIVPVMEGLFDADYHPSVFPGHLTKEQALEATKESSYAGQAIRESVEEAFLVTFTNVEGDVPEEDETGTWYDGDKGHAVGHLSYYVYHTEEGK